MRVTAEDLRFILGLKLKSRRQERGLSLSEVARRSGLSVSYLSEIEKGRKYPKADKLIRLAEAVGVGYDELISLEVSAELDPLKAALSSEFVKEFPFELFGIEPEDVFGVMSDDPAKAGAMIRAFLEIGRTYDVQVEHFLFAALRAYQQLHRNHFEELERAAAAYREARGWPRERAPRLEWLRSELETRYGYEIDEDRVPADPDLRAFRSVYLGGSRRKLLVNGRLRDSQKAFILAREVGYLELGLEERALTSSWLRVRSFEQVLNNFKASYFAGALMIDAGVLEARLRALFGAERWDAAAFRACLKDFEATPEMFFYRLTQVVGARFGLDEIFFMRIHSPVGEDRYRLTKVLNMSSIPVPNGIGLDEHYCRRWPAITAIREAAAAGAAAAEEPVVHVQRSRFVGQSNEFLVISVARPLALIPDATSSVSLGFLMNDAFRREVRFAGDPSIPRVEVDVTCERCPLPAASCADRAAAPTLHEQRSAQHRREKALERLLESAP